MALDDFLLELLEDPVDHGVLIYLDQRDLLYNPRLRIAYEVRGSIPVLLPDESRAVSDEEDASYRSARLTGPRALS